MWLIGATVCLLAAPWVQLSVRAGNGWPHNALRHHWLMPICCHFRHCKALLVTCLIHASGAIASIQTFTFTYALSHRIVSARATRVLCTALVVPAGSQRQWCIVVPSTSLSARRRRVIDHIGAAWSVVAIDATPVASAAALRCTAADDTESRNQEITMSLNFQSINQNVHLHRSSIRLRSSSFTGGSRFQFFGPKNSFSNGFEPKLSHHIEEISVHQMWLPKWEIFRESWDRLRLRWVYGNNCQQMEQFNWG